MFGVTSCSICAFTIVIGVIGLTIFLLKTLCSKKVNLNGRHVFITGGSSGIGLSVAEYALSLGAIITIAARDVVKLERAAAKMISKYPGSERRVHTVTLDVAAGFEVINKAIGDAEDKAGPIFMLVNCAGMAICGKLEDMTEKDGRYLTDLNFLGSLWPSKIVLPAMKARGEGIVVFVSSQAALLGIFGYSVYGATKWAVRGLGEAAMMEAIGTGVSVTICYPPDTDTPGLVNEEASKPQETKIISSSGGLYSPDAVGKKLVNDALDKKPYSVTGFEGWMMNTLCGTTSSGFFNTLLQCLLLGPMRFILLFYQYYFAYVIYKCRKDKNINKKAK